jgi:GAF domain-containing protein
MEWRRNVNDAHRLAAVASSGLVDTGPQDVFDRLIELALEITGASRGCITLVDAITTTAKSSAGFPESSRLFAPVEHSFCRFVVGSQRPFVVNDGREDRRTVGDPAIALFDAVAWAGFPVEDENSEVLGTFCVMDSVPHEWTRIDLLLLATLAKAASSEIALHKARAELALMRTAKARIDADDAKVETDGK